MIKFIIGLTIGLSIGTWTGASIVHRQYYPILEEQAKELEIIHNKHLEQIHSAVTQLNVCEKSYVEQRKQGQDFVVKALGIDYIYNKKIKENNYAK